MSAYTEAQRVSIRKWLGASRPTQSFVGNGLEDAITLSQAITDGGQASDSSTQTEILSLVSQLVTLDAQQTDLQLQAAVLSADGDKGVKLDAARGMVALNMRGRVLVSRVCSLLGLDGPIRDVFSSLPASPTGRTDITY